MSTHGCYAPPFPPSVPSSRMMQLDGGAQEPDATYDDSYDTGGAYYYVQSADDDQE